MRDLPDAAVTAASLFPLDRLALKMARAQLERGENPPMHTTATLVAALERITAALPHLTAAAAAESATAERARWAAALRELHRPFAIYDECDCEDPGHAGETVTDCGDFETCLDPMYSICAACCTVPEYGQTEQCAVGHQHSPGRPICRTAAIVADLLRGAS